MKQKELVESYTATFYKIKELVASKETNTKKYKNLVKEIEALWELLDNKSINEVRKILTGRPGT